MFVLIMHVNCFRCTEDYNFNATQKVLNSIKLSNQVPSIRSCNSRITIPIWIILINSINVERVILSNRRSSNFICYVSHLKHINAETSVLFSSLWTRCSCTNITYFQSFRIFSWTTHVNLFIPSMLVVVHFDYPLVTGYLPLLENP